MDGCDHGTETNHWFCIATAHKISIRPTLLPHQHKRHLQLSSIRYTNATAREIQPHKVGNADDFQLETVW